MGILIGMDEAGYGPHLGPLVVAATAWEVESKEQGAGSREVSGDHPAGGARCQVSEELPIGDGGLRIEAPHTQSALRNPKSEIDAPVDLYRRLQNVVAKRASERRIAIADSKVLYHPGQGLRQLERGLHAVLHAMRQSLGCWSEIVQYCGADPDGRHRRHCWPDGFDCRLPADAAPEELSRLGARFARACEAAGVRPLLIRARLVFPEEFNDLVAYYHSKGAALSHVTAGLLREVTDCVRPAEKGTGTDRQNRRAMRAAATVGASPLFVVCDKHGGRNYYTALLQHHFSEHWIAPLFESHAESLYEWGQPESRVRVVFRVNGERFMPTALASMTAKYLRELAMRALNEFWCARVSDLRPTAGYYRDAWRFKRDIAAKQRELGIDDRVLWRDR
jgi:hypothetical protein